jgi:hypothetical protein
MGKLSHMRGEPAEALPRFEESLRVFEIALGMDHPDLAEMIPDYTAALRLTAAASSASPRERSTFS